MGPNTPPQHATAPMPPLSLAQLKAISTDPNVITATDPTTPTPAQPH